MSNYDDYVNSLKKVKLDPSRKNLKPFPADYTLEQMIIAAVAEGNVLLQLDEMKKPSVKPAAPPQSKKVLDDALGKMSDNPYVRARTQILTKMKPEARSVIEKMEKGELPKDSRYDEFCKLVGRLGDQLSSKN